MSTTYYLETFQLLSQPDNSSIHVVAIYFISIISTPQRCYEGIAAIKNLRLLVSNYDILPLECLTVDRSSVDDAKVRHLDK
jgi:hypothetical protein